MIKSLGSICIALVLLVGCQGCRHNPAETNPAVVKAINANDASKLVKTISDGLIAADKTLDGLQTQEPDYYAKVKPWLVKLAKLDDVAALKVRAYNNGDLTADWKSALVELAKTGSEIDPTLFGFKNPDTQKQVTLGFQLLQAGLASVMQTFGGK